MYKQFEDDNSFIPNYSSSSSDNTSNESSAAILPAYSQPRIKPQKRKQILKLCCGSYC